MNCVPRLGITHQRTAYNHPEDNTYIVPSQLEKRGGGVLVACSKFWYFCWTSTVAVVVSPLTLPATTFTARFAQTLTSTTTPCI